MTAISNPKKASRRRAPRRSRNKKKKASTAVMTTPAEPGGFADKLVRLRVDLWICGFFCAQTEACNRKKNASTAVITPSARWRKTL